MRIGKILTVLLLIILIFGCASKPEENIAPPGWFLNPPSDNDLYRYFTISRKASLLEDIETLAGRDLYGEIVSTFGISEGQSQLADFDLIRSEIINVVKGQDVDGIKLIEKQIDETGTERIIYLLVELTVQKVGQIEENFEKILKAGSTASIYTEEADSLISSGHIYKGALSYIQAALESAESDNRFITEKNLDSAISHIEKISITGIEAPVSVAVGQNSIFKAQMTYATESENVRWDDVSIKVSFRDRKKGSVIGDRFAMLGTDDAGFVTFVHPSPGFTGTGRVEISLDLLRDAGSLDILKEDFADYYERLERAVESIKAEFNFDIVSSAPTVPTGVFIVDSDFLRKPLDAINTAQGLVAGLKGAGFDVDLVNLDRNSLFDLSEKELLRDLPYMVEGEIRRMIFGVAQITEFDDSAAGFTVVTEAAVKVVDLESGEILFNEKLSKRVQGGESQATINTSFKELGKSFSSLLIDKLP